MRRARLLLAAILAACSSVDPDPSLPGSPGVPARSPDGGGGVDDGGGASDGGDAAAPVTVGRLADPTFPTFEHAPGTGLAVGLVTDRIYDDLVARGEERMRDLAALGVRAIRIEIEAATPLSDYAKIVALAKSHGIETLAVFTQASVGGANPMAGTRADFDAVFVPKVIAAIDAATAAIPSLRYVEVWNEPDVYAFSPFYDFVGGSCVAREGAFRYALLTVRVFETMNERRKKGMATPTLAAFDFSHQDDACTVQTVANAPPIANHRAGYRGPNGLPDGLPTDIVSIHGYGNANRIPGESGYTYAGGTFADGVAAFLSRKFDDGKSIFGTAPVWYSELGFCLGGIGGPDPLERQRLAVERGLATLRTHPQITAAFVYSYRDDEPGGAERCGLRDNTTNAFSPHPAYRAFQAASVAGADRVAPGGTMEATRAGAEVEVKGWAIDASGDAPKIEIAVDGVVVTSLVDGATPHTAACKTASSARCPNVGFAARVPAPAGPGRHEIAARATDARGNARVIGRVILP